MLFNPGWKFKISQLHYKGILMYQNEPEPNMPWNDSDFPGSHGALDPFLVREHDLKLTVRFQLIWGILM